MAALMALSMPSTQAQHYIGIRGGAGGGMARFEPKQTGHKMRLLLGNYPSAGIMWKYYGRELGVGGLEIDLNYVTRGYRELSDRDYSIPDKEVYRTEYLRTMETIELPFFWHIHTYTFKRRLRLFVNLGIYASYMFSSREYKGPFGSDPVWTDYEIKSVRDNPFGYGLAGGAGFGVLLGRFEIFAEGRYAYGFSDVIKSMAKYPPNTPTTRSPVDAVNIWVGVSYRLGKGGILAPPAGTNRSPESWDSIPVGRNREAAAPAQNP